MVVLRCALVADLTVSWDLPPPTMFSLNSKLFHLVFFISCSTPFQLAHPYMIDFVPSAVSQVALDWVSGNWYFLDDNKELIFLCNSTLTICTTVVEVNLNKPRALALDPPNGYLLQVRDWHLISNNRHAFPFLQIYVLYRFRL